MTCYVKNVDTGCRLLRKSPSCYHFRLFDRTFHLLRLKINSRLQKGINYSVKPVYPKFYLNKMRGLNYNDNITCYYF